MYFNALMHCISKLEDEPKEFILHMTSSFLQEIIDPESFYENDMQDISIKQLLTDITEDVNEHLARMLMVCAIEFCITNVYQLNDRNWNCIEHIITHQSNGLSQKDIKYLTALNNSYMSIYKVVHVSPGKSVVLQDMIGKKAPKITVLDKSLSGSIKKGEHIGGRIVEMNAKKEPKRYQFSAAILVLPKSIVKVCINVIRNIDNAMLNRMLVQLFGEGEEIEETEQNRLLIKKMWAKEIAEAVYHYYSHYKEYHEMLDRDGNPWHPCIIEFNLNAPVIKIQKALSSMKELMPEPVSGRKNEWLWCDQEFSTFKENALGKDLPDVAETEKEALFHGLFIKNEITGKAYSVFAIISLIKDKLIIEVNSKQRANIAQDRISEELGKLVSDYTIHSKH